MMKSMILALAGLAASASAYEGVVSPQFLSAANCLDWIGWAGLGWTELGGSGRVEPPELMRC